MKNTPTPRHFNFDMVRPKRVKGRALKQRDWHMMPKKFRRPAPPPAAPPQKPSPEGVGGIDWELFIFIGLGFAALMLLLFWAYTNR